MKVIDMQVGDKLPNGATLLDTRKDRHGETIVLASFNSEFVSWTTTNDDANTTQTGNYFGDLTTAIADFEARS